jgi:two-component system, NarL family, sensor histidine kinase DesK
MSARTDGAERGSRSFWPGHAAVDDFEWTPRRRRVATALSYIWLGYLAPVAVELARHPPATPRLAVSVVALVAFVACYVRSVGVTMTRPFQLAAPYALAGMVVASAVLMWSAGYAWQYVFPYYFAALLPSHLPRRWWVPAQAAVAAVTAGVALHSGERGIDLFGNIASVVGVGLLMSMYFAMLMSAVQLRIARAELARLAVAEERLRISRDLHDVLGHRLAAAALTSDLAVRLATSDPARASAHMAEVGRIAREALDEVRATVAGFRDVSLAGELSTARALLAAAGIDCLVQTPGAEPLPDRQAEVAAWVVREAVTNVVRHSRARTVRIMVAAGDPAVVEVSDDGVARGGGPAAHGNGLTGLTERVTALGGTFTAGAAPTGGYRVRVELPVAARLAGTA